MTCWPIVERAQVLTELTDALELVAQGHGRVLVVQGHRGTGKSVVLAQLAQKAVAHNFNVASTDCRIEDRPPRMIQQLLGGWSEAPTAPPRRELVPVLDRAQDLEPHALLVDDAHLIDSASIRELAELARHAALRPLLIVLTLRTGGLSSQDRKSIEELCGLHHCVTVVLGPLRKRETKRLISEALPVATATFCDECAELSGGNPRLLRELITWISANHLDPVTGSPRRALEPVPPPAMRHFVNQQLEELGPDAAAIAMAVALSNAPRTSAAIRLSGLPLDRGRRAISALREANLLQGGAPLALGSQIAARCLRAQAYSELRNVLGRERGSSATGPKSASAAARQFLIAAPSPHPEMVERLVELAEHEVAEGNPADAKLLIRQALLKGAVAEHAKSNLLLRLGHAELVNGDPASTSSLASAAALTEHPRDRAEALLKLGVAQVAAGAPHHASVAFDAARHVASEDDALRLQAVANSAIAGLLMPEQSSAAPSRISELARGDDIAQQRYGPKVLLAFAWGQLCRGARWDEVASHVRDALAAQSTGTAAVDGYFDAAAAAVLTFVDDFRGAERVCGRASSVARSAGSLLAGRNLGIAQALTYLHTGRLNEAADSVRQVIAYEVDPSKFPVAGAAAILVDALREMDALAEAEAVLDRTRTTSVTEIERIFLLQAAAALNLARGRPAEALSAAQDAGHLAEAFGILNPAIVSWEPTQAVCYAASGDQDRARALVHNAVEVAETFGAPRAIALTLRARARVEGPPEASRDLARAHTVIEDSDSLLERAKVQVAYGAALHEVGRSEQARRWLRRGIDMAHDIGALRTARIGLAALVAAGGRPRRGRWTGVESLTPAERRVADLAGTGLSNREIAEELVVTRKTVEWHLRNAFSKLGVQSRQGLPEALNGEPREPDGSPSR